jgi:hypothetical protein
MANFNADKRQSTLLVLFIPSADRYGIGMGTQTRQGAVGFVIDRDYYEIGFPLEGPS